MEVIPFPNDTSEDGGHLLKQITKMEDEVGKVHDTFPDRNTLEIHINRSLKAKLLQKINGT